ncbi:MAG: hypothetical protein QOF24_425 [Verrucomicrobiota bacterium]|jgi:glycosyltransferase involved in cell wall biosynthesis
MDREGRARVKVLVAHPGTQYARFLARELFARGALARLATGFAIGEGSIIGRLEHVVPRRWRGAYRNRAVEVPASKLETSVRLELTAQYRLWQGQPTEDVFRERNAAFQRVIPDQWIAEATHVIGFDTSSWILAERCRRLGRPFILDQSIGHSRTKERIYSELRAQHADWAETIPAKSVADLEQEDQEHDEAVRIVAPSSFVRDTLMENGVAADKISIIPFGTDTNLFRPAMAAPPTPMIFLYAGALTARKGVPVLLEAWKWSELGRRAELWLAGPGKLPTTVSLPAGARLLGKLGQSELAETMRRAHVFVFPSCFEGLAQVQVEALASGLPVIGTQASGASDIVINGTTGFVVTAGDAQELADCMLRLLDVPGLHETMRLHCIARRDERSWHQYGDRWFGLLQQS